MADINNTGTEQTTANSTDSLALQESGGTTKHIKLTNLKLVGFDDYLFVQDVATVGGSSAPSLATFLGNIQLAAFNGSNTLMEVFGSIHIQHDYVAGSPISFHIHWSHNVAAPTGDVKWNLEYTIAKGYGQEAFAIPQTISLVQPAGAQYLHHIIEGSDIASSSIEVDSIILVRIWRDPADAQDTFAYDAFFIRCDVHFSSDSRTTKEKVAPFTKV